MNRAEKIKLLKDLEAGKRSLASLRPPVFFEFVAFENQPGYLFRDGEKLTRQEAERLIKQTRTKGFTCFVTIKTYQDNISVTTEN